MQIIEKNKVQREYKGIPSKDFVGTVFFSISLGLGIAAIIWMIACIIYYLKLGMGASVGALVIAAIISIWIWENGARMFWGERSDVADNNEKDPDLLEKERTHLGADCIWILMMIGMTFLVCNIAFNLTQLIYYEKLKTLYREYWYEYKGTRVDLTPREALLGDWEKNMSEFQVWNQGGTIYDYDRWRDGDSAYIKFRTVYDADWEGTRAIERYKGNLRFYGWQAVSNESLYIKEIAGQNYVIDLSDWDQYGESQVCICCYTEGLF